MLGYVWCGTCFFFSSCVNRALVMIGGSSWFLAFWRVNNQPKPWNLQIDWNSLFYATSTLLWGDPSSTTSCQHAEHIRQLGLWTAFTCCSKCLVGLNRNRCTTAEKIWREMAQLLKYCNISVVFSPLVWGCAVWPKSSCSTERLFRLSVCFDQAAATAGWQRFGQFFPVWICVFRHRLRYRDQYDLRKIADTWISFCFVNEAKHDLVPKLDPFFFLPCWTVFLSDFSNMNIVPELSSVPDSGKWLWFVPMFHFHYVPGVDHAQKKPAIDFARLYTVYMIPVVPGQAGGGSFKEKKL